MKKLLKKIYYNIICYDKIIETLYEKSQSNEPENESEETYLASPIFATRKQKREFLFSKENAKDTTKL